MSSYDREDRCSYDREDRYDRRKDNWGSKDILVGWGIDMRLVSKLGMYEFIKEAGDGERLVKSTIYKESIENQLDKEGVLDHIDRWLRDRGGRAKYTASVMRSESGQEFEPLGEDIVGLVFKESATRCREAAEDAASRYFPIDSPGAFPVYTRSGSLYRGDIKKKQEEDEKTSSSRKDCKGQAVPMGDERLNAPVPNSSGKSYNIPSYTIGEHHSPSFGGAISVSGAGGNISSGGRYGLIGHSIGHSYYSGTGVTIGCGKLLDGDNSICVGCHVPGCVKSSYGLSH